MHFFSKGQIMDKIEDLRIFMYFSDLIGICKVGNSNEEQNVYSILNATKIVNASRYLPQENEF